MRERSSQEEDETEGQKRQMGLISPDPDLCPDLRQYTQQECESAKQTRWPQTPLLGIETTFRTLDRSSPTNRETFRPDTSFHLSQEERKGWCKRHRSLLWQNHFSWKSRVEKSIFSNRWGQSHVSTFTGLESSPVSLPTTIALWKGHVKLGPMTL